MQDMKRETELTVLNAAKELLGKIYGKFDVDESQKDRPDAAIEVTNPVKVKHGRASFNVGIEITTVDPLDYLAYFNDTKHGSSLVAEKINKAIESGENIDQSVKYKPTSIPDNYISSRLIDNKLSKYAEYMGEGKYREIALLCFSELVNIESDIFCKGLKQWTDYNLSSTEFPYDVVVFVDLQSHRAERIYEKKKPMGTVPPPYQYAHTTIERSESFLLTGLVGKFMDQNPLITPKKKFENEK